MKCKVLPKDFLVPSMVFSVMFLTFENVVVAVYCFVVKFSYKFWMKVQILVYQGADYICVCVSFDILPTTTLSLQAIYHFWYETICRQKTSR